MPNAQQELKGDEKSFPFFFLMFFLLSSLFHGSKDTLFYRKYKKITFAIAETFSF